jgi:hypothetical protein
MPTSGITSWPLTAEEIITQSLVELGAISSGETPTGEEMNDALFRLNSLLKTWAGEANMFRESSGTLVIPGTVGAGTLPAGIRDVSSARHVVSASYKRQLAEWNRSQFYSLPNRAQTTTSGPSVYYVGKGVSGLSIYVWPVPSTDITLELDYSRSAETVTDPSETVDIPEDWQEAVVMALAGRCASMFGDTDISPSTVARIDAKASALYQRLLDRDRPDSYYFEPDA